MKATLNKPVGKNSSDSFPTDQAHLADQAHAIVDSHSHFYRRAHMFEFCCRANCLVIRGSVPSFYLKQVLQTALLELSGPCKIDNQVSVVSGFGLSSVFANDD